MLGKIITKKDSRYGQIGEIFDSESLWYLSIRFEDGEERVYQADEVQGEFHKRDGNIIKDLYSNQQQAVHAHYCSVHPEYVPTKMDYDEINVYRLT